MRRVVPWAVLLLGGIVLLALFVGRGERDDATDGSIRERRPASEAPASPRLEGAGLPLPPGDGEEVAPLAPGTGCIVGRVVDEMGAVVTGLSIRLDAVRERTACDAEGRFRIVDVPPGRRRVQALAGGGSRVGRAEEVNVAAGEPCAEVELVVPVPRVLGGVVVSPAGEPVPILSLRVRPIAGIGFGRGVSTDAEGCFAVRMWEDGPFEATVRGIALTGELVAGRTDARLVYDPAAGRDMLIRVEGPDGALIPRCRLMVLSGTQGGRSGSSRDIEGGLHRLSVDRLGPIVDLHVEQPCDDEGEPLPLAGWIAPEIDLEADEIVIRLEAARTVRGVVVDESGTPVAGIEVHAAHTDPVVPPWPLVSATSDAAGRFVLGGLPRAALALGVRVTRTPWAQVPLVPVPEDGSDVRIVLRRGRPFVVRVRGPTGRAVVGADVTISWIHDETAGVARGTTDEAGAFAIAELPPVETLTVYVYTGDLDEALPSFSRHGLPYGDGELTIDLPSPVEVRGVVVDEKGMPWSDARVFAIGIAPSTKGPVDKASIDPETGAFVLRRLRQGRYQIWIPARRYGQAPTRPIHVTAPTEGVRIVVSPPHIVTGRLIVADPGNWTVQWCQEPMGGSTRMAKGGQFRIVGIRDEPGALLACRHPFGTGERSTQVALRENVLPGDGPFELRPVEGERVAGVIDGYARLPRSSATLSLVRGPVSLVLPVDEAGRFDRRDIPPGTWTLQLRVHAQVRAELEGVASGRTDVVLVAPE